MPQLPADGTLARLLNLFGRVSVFVASAAVGGVVGHYAVFGAKFVEQAALGDLISDTLSGRISLTSENIDTFSVVSTEPDLNPNAAQDTKVFTDVSLFVCEGEDLAVSNEILPFLRNGAYGRIERRIIDPSDAASLLLSAEVTVVYDPQISASRTLESRLLPDLLAALHAGDEERSVQILPNPANSAQTDSRLSVFFC